MKIKFQNLLTPTTTPAQEQHHATTELTNIIKQSHLQWWKDKQPTQNKKYILLIIAPYSQHDLTLLDILEEKLTTHPHPTPIYIANILDYQTIEHLNQDIPGITIAHPTPIIAHHTPEQTTIQTGQKARELILTLTNQQ